MKDPTWNYVVLAIALASEGASFTIAMKHFLARKGDWPFWPALRQSKDPKLFIPLGEDSAALAGLVVAFLGVFLSH